MVRLNSPGSTGTSMVAIQTVNLTRVFKHRNGGKDTCALDGISISIDQGEIFGLLGPNGAGKTTLVKILSTILVPTSGTASVMGHDVVRDVEKIRNLIGIVIGGERGIYWQLTGRQNLEYWAALYNVPVDQTVSRVEQLLERVGLREKANDLVESYSRGMKQRLHLARGLIGNAQILFLDEPTTGMDPVASIEFRELVKQLQSEGRTILLTTHDMAEAESVCDRVALIDHGHVLALETPYTLSKLIARHERIDFESSTDGLMGEIRQIAGVSSVQILSAQNFRVELSDGLANEKVLRLLIESGITSIRTSRPNLEEVYIQLIGERGLKV